MSDTLPQPAPRSETSPYRHLGAFVAAVLATGAIRFGLSVSGVDDSVARWSTMTGVILIGCVYFAWRTRDWRQRLVTSYALVAPYMLVEAVGIGHSWTTGTETIFHREPYTLGTSIGVPFWGHVVGGLTWEPWALFLLMCLLAWVFRMAK